MGKVTPKQVTFGLLLVAAGIAVGVLGAVVYWNLTGQNTSAEIASSSQSDLHDREALAENAGGVADSPVLKSDDPETPKSPAVGEVESRIVDPKRNWDALLNDGQSDIEQVDAFLDIASAWANKDGLSIVDRVRESIGDSAVADVVVLSLLHDAVQTDPTAAFQSALSLSPQSRDDALVSVVRMWAKADPIATLEALNSANLGGLLRGLQETLVNAWTESDPKSLLNSLAHLPELLRNTAEQQAMLGIARTNPPDAVEYLSRLPDDPNDDRRYDLAYEIAEHWSRTDPYAALEWVASVPFPGVANKRPQRKLLTKVLRNLAIEDPNLAMQSALNDPIGRFGHGLEPYVVSKVAQVNTEKAIAMLSSVRDGATKAASYRSVGRALAENGEFERAVELGSDLPDDQQSNYFSAVFSRWARSDPGRLFKSLDQLPSLAAKTQAAYNLLEANRRGVFTDEERNNLQDIVDSGAHNVTTVATLVGESQDADGIDVEARLLELELESNWNDGVERVFVLSGN